MNKTCPYSKRSSSQFIRRDKKVANGARRWGCHDEATGYMLWEA